MPLPTPTEFPQADSAAIWGEDHPCRIVQHLKNGEVLITGPSPVNRRIVPIDELSAPDARHVERAGEIARAQAGVFA